MSPSVGDIPGIDWRRAVVDFEPGASLLDHIGLFQDLEDLLGVGVDVVARSALKTKLPDEVIKATPEVPWREVLVTLRDDVSRLDQAIKHWRQAQA